MAARRLAGHDDLVDVHVVVLRLGRDEPQRAQRVLHAGRRGRHAGHPVFDVHHVPAHFQPRHDGHERLFLGPANPSAAVIEDERGLRRGHVAATIDVELRLEAGRREISDVGSNLILILDFRRPVRRGGDLRERGNGAHTASKYKKCLFQHHPSVGMRWDCS